MGITKGLMSEPSDIKETGRVEAFSDGVFAIAMTLLVLELHAPKDSEIQQAGNLAVAILQMWPSFIAFVLGFSFVLVGWINHHRVFTHIRRVDGAFLLLNGMLLMLFTLVPYPIAVLATHINGPDAKTAIVLYSTFSLLVAIGYQCVWRYASHNGRLLRRDMDKAQVQAITRQYSVVFPIFVVGFALSFLFPYVGLSIMAGLILFFAARGFSTAHRVS